MVNFKTICLLTFALLAVHLCNGQDNTTSPASTNTAEQNTVITTTGSTTTASETEAIENGMQGIYKLYQNFLQTVMSENFYTTSSAFSLADFKSVVESSDYKRLQNDWKNLAKTFGGFAACIIFGLMFALFMPLTGCIYCCCHCFCHKCGGTRQINDPTRAKCKRWIYTIMLLICATFMLTGGVVTFLGGNLLRKSLINENNQGAIGKIKSNLDKMEKFVDKAIKDVQQTTQKHTNEGLDKVLANVRDAVHTTVDKIKENINATNLLDEAQNIGNDAGAVGKDLKDLNVTLTNLKKLQNNISIVINDTNNKLIKYNISIPSFVPDFNQFFMHHDLADNITNAWNITSLVFTIRCSLDDILGKVQINHTINKTVTQIEQVRTTVQSALNTLNETTKPFTIALDDFINDTFNESDLENIFKMAGDYTWYACIGMGSSLLLVVLFYYIAVVFGLCGERPKERAPCCNRGTGASLLCVGITISFVFSFILMLVVIVLFSLGGLSYTMACRYLNGGIEGISTIESVISNVSHWDISNTLKVSNLTLSVMFRNCKENQGLYQAFHLQSVFNLDEKFNMPEVTKKVNGFVSINMTEISSINWHSGDLENNLSFADSGLKSVNFSLYLDVSNKTLFGNDTNLSTQIKNLINKAKISPNVSKTLNNTACTLQSLQDQEIKNINTERENLSRIIQSLKQKAKKIGKSEVQNLIKNINKSLEKFNTEKDNVTKQGLQVVANEIIQTINNTMNSVKAHIENGAGQCKELYDAAQGLVDAVCIVTLNPLNAIWFGLGWALFFYIPCIIFAALLSSLYQRRQPYEKMTEFSPENDHADNVPLSNYTTMEEHVIGNGLNNMGYQDMEHQPNNVPYGQIDTYGQQKNIYPQLHNGDPRNHYGGGYRGYPPQYYDDGPSKFNQSGYDGGYVHPIKY